MRSHVVLLKKKVKTKSKPRVYRIKLLHCYNLLYFAGPVVMNKQGFTEKGFKRKLAVQTLFGKIYYLSEVIIVETLLFTAYVF